MSAPQLTFLLTTITCALGLTVAFYPGVRRHAQRKRDSLLAAGMAAGLCSIPVAWFVAAVVNAIGA